jgi:hypothetical protein
MLKCVVADLVSICLLFADSKENCDGVVEVEAVVTSNEFSTADPMAVVVEDNSIGSSVNMKLFVNQERQVQQSKINYIVSLIEFFLTFSDIFLSTILSRFSAITVAKIRERFVFRTRRPIFVSMRCI